ncbi:HNH endonuclease [Kineococcus sp. NUM-3379]
MRPVLVLNACGTVLHAVEWQRAVTLLLTLDAAGRPVAVVHEAEPERLVRSPSTSVPWPRAVRLTRWVHVPATPARRSALASRRAVLERDRHTCVYCGARARTVDHLLPRSRGGPDTWENLAACCEACNTAKADRTPQEAGMRPRWTPWRPDATVAVQRQVWRRLGGAAALPG